MSTISRCFAVLLLAVLLALGIAACGGDDSDDSEAAGTEENGAVEAEGGSVQTETDLTEVVDVGERTIAYIDLVGQASGAQTIRAAAEEQAAEMGWTLETSDAGGDVASAADLIETAVTQEVDAIMGVAIPVAAIGTQIERAVEAGIPYAAVNSGFDPNATFSQLTQEWAGASTEALYIANRLESAGEVAIISNTTLQTVQQREAAFRSTLQAFPEIEIVANHEVDLTDLVGDAQSATADIIRANPELDAIWAGFEDPGVGAMNAVQEAGGDAPFVVSYAEGGPLLEAQQEGRVAAVLAFPLESHGRDPLAILSQYLADEEKPTGLAVYNDLTFLSDRDTTPEEEVMQTPSYVLFDPGSVGANGG